MKKLFLFLLFIFITGTSYAKIAVIPYRIELPPGEIKGGEYSRLLCLNILISKETEVLSPEETDIGLRQMGIKPEGSVTEEDLFNFGTKYRLDYILIGTVTKRKKLYYFDNVLYTVNSRKISRNTNTAADIFRLANQEVKDSLFSLSSREQVGARKQADVAFVIDLSYNINDEWETVKDAINEMNSTLVGRYGVDTRIFILPFSDRKDQVLATTHDNSVKGVKDKLNSLQPAGSPDLSKFMSVLNHTIRSMKWRSGSVKEIIVITNSKLSGIFMSEKYASEAKRRGIRISVISCGRITGEFGDIERLPELTGGSTFSVSYHQTVHDASGDKHELYLQRGRVFFSMSLLRSWRGGLLISMNKNPKYVKVPDTLEEIFMVKPDVQPGKIATVFSDTRNLRLVEKDRMQNNIGDIIETIKKGFASGAASANYGKALVSDGKLSLWVRVSDRKVMEEFTRNESKGFYTRAGFIVRQSETDAYGVELIPVIAGITPDYVPERCRATLSEIIKNPDFYSANGAGFPPVWFVEVKIEKSEGFEGRRDVRD